MNLNATTAAPSVAWAMEYDAFGREIAFSSTTGGGGVSIATPPFRFSTKYTDGETGLVYYGYRYYAPEMGRWLSRDPIAERGGINLYGMLGNDAVNQWDYSGQGGGPWGPGFGMNPGQWPGPPPPTPEPPPPQKRDCGAEYIACTARGVVAVSVFAGCLAPEKTALDKVIPGFGLGTAVVGSATGLAALGYKWACDTQKAECEQWNTNNGF
jgi:RHS repeat-associated protein